MNDDTWDPDQPTPMLLENLSNRVTLAGEPALRVVLRNDLERFNEVAIRVNRLRVREAELSELEQVALTMIVEDLAYLRRRLTAAAAWLDDTDV